MTKLLTILAGILMTTAVMAIEITPNELSQMANLGASVCYPYQGCTGTSTLPSYGEMLVGDGNGGYDILATSTLGITAVVNWGEILGTLSNQADLQTELDGKSSSFDTLTELNALIGETISSTTHIWDFSDYTNATADTGIKFTDDAIGFDCSEVEGVGINCATEAITLDNTGAWAGTLTSFGSDFYTYFNATSTDALSEGATNKYMTYPDAGIPLSTGSAWDTSITNNSANWNTAYDWGNHALGGYLGQAYASTTYLLINDAYTQAIASTTFVDRADWTTHDNYPIACTAGKYITTIGDTNTCDTPTDTTYTAGGTLLDLTTGTFSINEGTLTDDTLCNYDTTGTQIECTTVNNSSNWDTAYGWGDHAGLYDPLGQATSTKDWLLTQDNAWTGAGNTSFAGNIALNSSTTAKDIFPLTDNLYQLGNADNTFADAFFTDDNGVAFSANNLATAQRRIRSNTSYLDYTITNAVSGGVWTYTITEASGTGFFAFNIDNKVLINVAATMTVDIESYAGTDANPKDIYVYVKNTGDAPELVASNTSPEGIVNHVDIANIKAGTVHDSTVTNYGSFSAQLWSEDFIFNTYHRFWHDGAQYRSGMDIYADSGDVRIATGTMAIIFDELTSDFASTSVETLFYTKNDGTYATSTTYDFNDEYSTGETISNDKYFGVTLGIIPINGGGSRILALVQKGDVIPAGKEYKDVKQVIKDEFSAQVYQPDDDLLKNLWIPVAFVVVKNTGTGVIQEVPESGTGVYYYDIRNQATGGGAGSNPSVSTPWSENTTSIYQDDITLNVGIGTSTPNTAFALDVYGNVRIDGNATSTLFSASYASSTDAYFGTAFFPNLITPAGTLVAIDGVTGEMIATTSSAGGGDPDQNLWETIAGDSGSTAADTTTDTLTIAGGNGNTTIMAGDTLTVNSDITSITTLDALFSGESVASSTGNANIILVGALTSGSLAAGFTDVVVAQGGTGASSFTDHGVIVGSGTDPLAALTVGTDGQLLIGDSADDPVFATLNCDDFLTCTTGAGTLEIDADTGAITDGATTVLATADAIYDSIRTATSTMEGTTNITTLGTIGTGAWEADVISLTYGGTNKNMTASNGGIVYTDADSMEVLAGTATANQMLRSGSAATPNWTTSTWDSTYADQDILYANGANTVEGLTKGSNGEALITNYAGNLEWVSTSTFGGGGGGAPIGAEYLVLMADGDLTDERVLTGTANQITVTDNGAGNTAVLSLPQSINTTNTVQFGSIGVGSAIGANLAFGILGNLSPSGTASMSSFAGQLTAAINASVHTNSFAGQLVSAGSGTHAFIANVYLEDVNVIDTGANLTNSVNLYIEAPLKGLVADEKAYAMWSDAGENRFDGNVGIGTTSAGTLLSVGDTTGINFTVATSTFSSTGGIKLTNGCFELPDGTCLSSGGSGDVSKVGTPANSQIGVWTGDGTIEGDASLTYDQSNLLFTGDLGADGTEITKGWFTDLDVTNAIAGSITGNAATVTNATLTTALTVNTGTLTLTADAGNDSVLTIGGGAVDVSGSNTGDQNLSGYALVDQTMYIGSTAVDINRTSATLNLAGIGTLGVGAITSSGTLALSANDITMSGSLADTTNRVTKGWFTDLESANDIIIGGTALASIYSPIAGSASIVTTGALNSGSIASGFGNIDIGSSNFDADGTITSTGVIDFGGATSLELPQDGTVDATGEIQLNTATSSLEIYDGSKVAVIPSDQTVGFSIASTTFRNFSVIPIKSFKENLTITNIQCFVVTATDQDIFISDGTNDTETIACTVAGAEDDGSIANGTFNAREQMFVEMGTAAGDPDWLHVEITYSIDN